MKHANHLFCNDTERNGLALDDSKVHFALVQRAAFRSMPRDTVRRADQHSAARASSTALWKAGEA